MRIQTRGALVGPCNICGNHGKLTFDHIPPKGVIRPRQVEIMTLADMLSVDRPSKSTRLLQDGVKFRTLCHTCNSTRLGARYDPSLIELANGVRSFLLAQARLLLPVQTTMHCKVNRLARSITGHILANGVQEAREGTALSELREYFLNEEALFPRGMSLHYWVYPYNDQVATRGLSFTSHLWEGFTVAMLLKFFPIAFLIVLDHPSTPNSELNRLDRLDPLLDENIDQEHRLTVRFTGLPARRWPEFPTDTTMVMHGEDAVAAVPRTQSGLTPRSS
jgi:hypothetical protein